VEGLPGPILRADQGQLCLRPAAMVHMVRQPLSATLRGPSRSHGAVGAGHRGARRGRLHGGSYVIDRGEVYRFAVIDGLVEHSQAAFVRRRRPPFRPQSHDALQPRPPRAGPPYRLHRDNVRRRRHVAGERPFPTERSGDTRRPAGTFVAVQHIPFDSGRTSPSSPPTSPVSPVPHSTCD
jgi:hypothetical protein